MENTMFFLETYANNSKKQHIYFMLIVLIENDCKTKFQIINYS